jgi:hypothetical protein
MISMSNGKNWAAHFLRPASRSRRTGGYVMLGLGLAQGPRGFGPIPLVKPRAEAIDQAMMPSTRLFPISGHVAVRSDWSESAIP